MGHRNSLFISCVVLLAVLFTIRPLSWVVHKDLLVNRAGFSHAVFGSRRELLRLSLSSDDKYRLWTPLSEISPAMIEATLSQEDSWFYFHPGINPVAIARAVFLTYLRGARSGGSTITMQLVRLRYGLYTRSLWGKVKQIFLALSLEAVFTKNELLEAYLNLAPYGSNIEGVGAAARIYYGKSAKDLSQAEGVTLSVIPQFPAKRVPVLKLDNTVDQSSLVNAKTRLIARLAGGENKLIQQVYAIRGRKDLPDEAPHFVERMLREHQNEPVIQTTLDMSAQKHVERLIEQFVERNDKLGIKNASVLVVEAKSMQVKAYVGSAHSRDESIQGYVDGIIARRSPGSALKPFVYALALQKGLIHPGSILKDTSFTKSNYNPENFEKDFVGPISATDALIRSRNIPAVSLLNQLSPEFFYQFLENAGIGGLKEQSFYGLSLVLGGVEVRMDEMAKLYAMLANGGILQDLKLTSHDTGTAPKQILSHEASRLVLEMLSENPRPSQMFDSLHKASQLTIPWKTGTSFSFRDAWAVGIVGQYVLVVWIGNFDGKPNPSFVGRDAAGPLFFSIADALSAEEPLTEGWRMGDVRIKKVHVCAVSGELPGPFCHHLKNSWFIPGVSPIHTCQIHRRVFVDRNRGVTTCDQSHDRGKEEILEFWPSDLLQLYKSAGLPRAEPPSIAPECSGVQSTGQTPLITSPDAHIRYILHGKHDKIPLHSVIDADSKRSFWFVDDALVGEVATGDTLFWEAHAGEFLVRVVDEQGRSNEVMLHIE